MDATDLHSVTPPFWQQQLKFFLRATFLLEKTTPQRLLRVTRLMPDQQGDLLGAPARRRC